MENFWNRICKFWFVKINRGFLQTFSVLGYSLVPILLASIFIKLFGWSKILDFVVSVAGCYWSIVCNFFGANKYRLRKIRELQDRSR